MFVWLSSYRDARLVLLPVNFVSISPVPTQMAAVLSGL